MSRQMASTGEPPKLIQAHWCELCGDMSIERQATHYYHGMRCWGTIRVVKYRREDAK